MNVHFRAVLVIAFMAVFMALFAASLDLPVITHAQSSAALITDFEEWGMWRRGDEPWGDFTQSQEQVYSGNYSGKLRYDFPAVHDNYVVFLRDARIPGDATALRMWVYGDGSGNFLNAWVKDATDHRWQFTFGRIYHSGWKEMTASINPYVGWPNELLDDEGPTAPVYPIHFYALVVDGALDNAPSSGVLYFDALTIASTDPAAIATSQARPAMPTPTAMPASTSTPVRPASAPTPRATPRPAEAAPASRPSLVTDFEQWGTWERGEERWGTFEQSREQARSGSFGGKLTYDFPAIRNNYVVFLQDLPVEGEPNALHLWVYGDASANFLNIWVQDDAGRLWQFTFDRITHSGWREMTARFTAQPDWPAGLLKADGTPDITYPIRLYALMLDGTAENGTSSGTIYVDDLTASTSRPATATTRAPTATPVANAPAAAAPASETSPGAIITDFEEWGMWRRGDEPWGDFTQSQEQVYSGNYSGKLRYDFPAVHDNYVVFLRDARIPGDATALRMWVYGDGSGNFLNAWVKDATDHRWQFTFGRIYHSGWKEMTASINPYVGWPNELLDDEGPTAPVYPIHFYALVVDGALDNAPSSGTLFFDSLAVSR